MNYTTLPTVSVGTATSALLVPATYQAMPGLKFYTVAVGTAGDIHFTSAQSCDTNSPWIVRAGSEMNIPCLGGPLWAIAASATVTVKVGTGAGPIP